MAKLHIKKGDNVVLISGDEKGKTGKVLKVLVKEQRVIVEGINFVTKSTKPSAKNPQGGFQKIEAPIHVSNVMLLDPAKSKANKPVRTRVTMKVVNGKKVRIAKKSGEEIK